MNRPPGAPSFNPRPQGTDADLGDPARELFRSQLVRVGSFRCPVRHPHFQDAGTIASHEFVIPRSAVWIQHEGKPPFVGDPTHAALYNPAQPFLRRAISPEGDRSDWFGVAPELIREVMSGFAPATQDAEHVRFTATRAPIDAQTYRFQRAIFDYARTESEPDVLTVEESVIDILCRLLSSVYGRPLDQCTTVRRHRELAENARAHLAAHYARKESLTDAARALGCSVFHLCRVFRRYTGRTLHDYRQELRVRHALELVSAGSRDLLDVAIALGYSSHSHFTAAFREAFGEPPSIVRATTLMACITRLSSTSSWPHRTPAAPSDELDKLLR